MAAHRKSNRRRDECVLSVTPNSNRRPPVTVSVRFQDANDQLEKIDPFNRAAPEVLAVRLAIHRGLKKWELMQQIAKRLKQFDPDIVQWTISLAYATRRACPIDIAMEILLGAEAKFPRAAAIP